ncbi:hypothetical protein [Methanosarcina barkeri]|uniref:hypothetical protein n=1 Tax=Methanosarcina barkeri TaxID=2208 RepID=UPI00064F937B|nr:hypothetical protein [Methanosarcina barkeri]
MKPNKKQDTNSEKMKPNKKQDVNSEKMKTNKKQDTNNENPKTNKKLDINSEKMSKDAFTYITWAILIISPLYALYFLYSLATGGSIIYSTIPSVIFFVAGTITLFDILAVQQIMNVKN